MKYIFRKSELIKTSEKSIYLIFLFSLIFSGSVSGQVSSYGFSQSSGTYTPISGGTLHGSGFYDESYSFTLPFTFIYNSVAYTSVRPTSNGFLVLGSVEPSISNYNPLSTGNTNFAISALGSDLVGTIRSEVLGTSPNRIYVCQWSDAYRYVHLGENLNAQIRLYESTNVIELVYGGFAVTNTFPLDGLMEIGIRGDAATDFNNRTTTSNWSTTTAGGTNTATMIATSTVKPVSGQTYTFTPTPCAAIGGFNSSLVTYSTATIGWTAAPTATGGYEWELRSTGTCGSGSPLQSGISATTSVNLTGLSAVTAYTYCVRSICAGPSNSVWASSTFLTTPSNDDCTNASVFGTVPTTNTCITLSNQSTFGATQSQIGCAGTADNDLWYSFVAPATSITITLTNVSGSPDRVHQLFSGACGSLTSVACSDPETSTTSGLTIGNTYYVRVHTYISGTSSVFNICLKAPIPPPSNNDCVNASVFGTVPIDGTCITLSNQSTVGATQSQAGCVGTADNDVWYRFVAPATSIIIELTDVSGSSDRVHQLFSGVCGSLSSLRCSDPETSFTTGLTIGNTYYVRVHTYFFGSSSVFNICLKIPPTSSDECGSAIILTPEITPCDTPTLGTVVGATNSSLGICTISSGDDDVWFKFVATHSSTTISTSGFDGVIDVMSSADGTCGMLASLGCFDDVGSSDVGTVTTTIGSSYYIRFYSYSNTPLTGEAGIFSICLTIPPPPTITSLGSTSGCPGNTLVINGTNLTGATPENVTVGLTPVESIFSNTGTVLTVIVGSGTTGTVKVTIGSSMATSAEAYTINPIPTLIVANPAPVCFPATQDISSVSVQMVNTGSITKYYTTSALAMAGGQSNVADPTMVGNGTYFIRSESLGCYVIGTVGVVVNDLPASVTATSSANTNCLGNSIDLMGSATGIQTILSEGFESGLPSGWTIINGGSGNNWSFPITPIGSVRTGTRAAEYEWSSANADTWLFTSAQNLTAGVNYTVSSWYRTAQYFPERLKVTVGSSATISSQTTVIQDLGTIQSATYTQQIATFTPSTTGIYYFAWNAYSTADQYFINLDDIAITSPALFNYTWTSTPIGFTSSIQNPTSVSPLLNTTYHLAVTYPTTGCSSTASVAVSIATTATVTTTDDAGSGSLRAAIACVAEGGTITYDQPATVTTLLTAPLDFTKSVTIQGLDINNRPEITLPAAGSAISTGKILTLRNVDIKSPGTTFTGDGEVKVDDNTVTVIKQ